ncbi:cyclic nucleotide-binding domain-containing protein [Paracoccus litorisediminis]|uniref:Cyclic nucleotide-binding domain-containing protein n=1 Tax=Paracoccus litorisediminis TaxID=2006130 RepID=A0A844HSV0_9RHOB|nr:cyclic nucleotide-binding domain-containing protein [Paracoccus litorisediminis]MTH61407.1 cyclic nucleotide-binding domain-containing protein [Paracoccus litorisediminis]
MDLPARPAAATSLPKAPGRMSSIVAGFLLGLDSVGESYALASLCFAGALATGLGSGTLILLFSTAVSAFSTALFSRIPGALGTAQDASIAVLAAAMASAAAATTGGPAAALVTAIAVMGISTTLTGIALLLLGKLRLTRFARLLPFAVSCGFLAACGLLLIIAAIELVLGGSPWQAWRGGLDADKIKVLLPAIGLALLLALSGQHLRTALGFLTVLVAAVAGFWIVQAVLGQDIAGLVASGQLVSFDTTDQPVLALGQIDVAVLLGSSGAILVVVLLNVLSVVLNLSGIELDSRRDVDFDHETRLAGGANILIGLFGGLVSYADSPTTALTNSLGLRRNSVGLGYGLAALTGCVFMGWLIPYFPVFVSTGILLFIGYGLVADWLWSVRRQIDRLEWCVVIAVVAVACLVDILAAIGLGILLSALSFAMAYGRTPLVSARWSARERRSPLDRAPSAELWLSGQGAAIQGLTLFGHIYFGRVDLLRKEIRGLKWPDAAGQGLPRQLILDFSSVSGLDGAACAALMRILLQLGDRDVTCWLAGLNADCLRALRAWDRDFDIHAQLRLAPDVATALEAAETLLLAHAPPEALAHGATDLPDAPPGFFKAVALAQGDLLVTEGSAGDEVWYLQSGQLGVFARTTTGPKRLRSLAPGNLVGEIALYTAGPRSAEIRADAPCRLLCFAAQDLRDLEASDPATAFAIHRWLARGLGEKLVRANRLLG